MTDKQILKEKEGLEEKKNCDTCKYGYLSSVCKKPSTDICGNNFSLWESYTAERSDKE